METPIYLHLIPGEALPLLEESAPFKAVLVIDSEVAPQWRAHLGKWLIQCGCRYMMAWGKECRAWETSVDEANLAIFNYNEIPEDAFVMTTQHEKKSLQETFWYSEWCAMHPSLKLEKTYIVHIAPEDKGIELLDIFCAARDKSD